MFWNPSAKKEREGLSPTSIQDTEIGLSRRIHKHLLEIQKRGQFLKGGDDHRWLFLTQSMTYFSFSLFHCCERIKEERERTVSYWMDSFPMDKPMGYSKGCPWKMEHCYRFYVKKRKVAQYECRWIIFKYLLSVGSTDIVISTGEIVENRDKTDVCLLSNLFPFSTSFLPPSIIWGREGGKRLIEKWSEGKREREKPDDRETDWKVWEIITKPTADHRSRPKRNQMGWWSKERKGNIWNRGLSLSFSRLSTVIITRVFIYSREGKLDWMASLSTTVKGQESEGVCWQRVWIEERNWQWDRKNRLQRWQIVYCSRVEGREQRYNHG